MDQNFYTQVKKDIFNLVEIIDQDGCFDLQFRKDVRHERSGSPTYYRFRIQFIITMSKENNKILERVKKELACGKIYLIKNQARFCVQDINEIFESIIPYLQKNTLRKKKNEFGLWQKAAHIILENKGKKLLDWKKSDLNALIQIHKSIAQYKQKPRKSKWLETAKNFTNGN